MRKLIVLALACITFTTVNAQEKNPDSIIHKAFNAIKTQDENAFLSIFPNYQQTRQFLEDYKQSIKDSEAKKGIQRMLDGLTDSVWNHEALGEIRNGFREQLGELRKRKIRPDDLMFTKADYHMSQIPGDLGKAIKTVTGIIYLKNGTEDMELPFSDVVWIESQKGWFGINLNRIRKRGEIEMDIIDSAGVVDSAVIADSVAIADSVVVKDVTITVEETPPPPPPPPPKKPVTKKPVKSSARKPD